MTARVRALVCLCALSLLFGGCARSKKFAYEGFDRDRNQQPERVVAALQLKAGDRVADLGAGGGYFTFRFAEAVGPTGRVYAVDIDPDMIDYLRTRAAEEGYGNVEVIAATADSSGLAPNSVDLLFTCNTYHHLGDRTAYFQRAAAALRPGGRVAIIDMNGSGWFSWLFGHNTPAETIRTEMTAAGYHLVAQPDFLQKQSFLIFEH